MQFPRESSILWHQGLPLAPDVDAPGPNDIGWIAQRVDFPEDLSSQSVLDIGTTNGGAASMAEARGAASMIATDFVESGRSAAIGPGVFDG